MTAQLPVAEPADVRRAAVRLIRADGRAFVVVLAPERAGRRRRPGRTVAARPDHRHGPGRRRGGTSWTGWRWPSWCARWRRCCWRGTPGTSGTGSASGPLARVREQFVERALALPASVVERAGTGDLTARGTADVAAVGTTLRDAGPEVLDRRVAGAVHPRRGVRARPAARARCAAGLARSDLVRRPLVSAPGAHRLSGGGGGHARSSPRCSRPPPRARAPSRRSGSQRAADRRRAGTAIETVPAHPAAHAVPAQRVLPGRGDLATSCRWSVVLLVGGALHERGAVSLGAVVAAALYLRQLVEPLDQILIWVEQLQSSSASFARVEGLGRAPRAVPSGSPGPGGRPDRGDGVRYAYDRGREVLHGVDLTVRPGRTAGRRRARPAPGSPPWAGCWPASTRRAPAR